MSGRLPNTVNLNVRDKRECVVGFTHVLMHSCLNLCVCVRVLSYLCAYAYPFLSMRVQASTGCRSVCVLLTCIHGYKSLTAVRVHAQMYTFTCVGVLPCTSLVRAACKSDMRVFCGFICELWTLLVHAGGRPIYSLHCLPEPLYND